jgi:hypothetical protein
MGLGRCELAAKQLFCENFPGDLQVGGDVRQNLSECSDLQDSMGRDRDVVFSTPEFGSQAHMAAGLATYFITVSSKQSREFFSAQIARKFQALMTSSFTMCRRMTLGLESSPK